MTIKKAVLILLGLIFLGLGMIGAVLPILPTTPFLLVASLCFVRGSTKMNNWLLNHHIFGAFLKNYLDERAIKKRDLIRTLIILWMTLIVSIFFIDVVFLKFILVIVGSSVSIHLLSLKSI